MLETGILIEGQNGLTWPRWQNIVRLVESWDSSVCIAPTISHVQQKLQARRQTFEQLRQNGAVVGMPNQVKEQLHELEKLGLQRVMLQWLDLDDLHGLEELAKATIL